MASLTGKIFKWFGIALGAVIVIVVVLIASFYIRANSAINAHYDVPASRPLYVPMDSATVAQGRHLANSVVGCTECHGAHLEGTKFFDDPAFGRLYPPNITRGKGGLPASYDIVAFERALRHGIRTDGTSLWVMPAYHFSYICDEDVAALWAYISSVPPADNVVPARKLGPIGSMLMAQRKLEMQVAPLVDHTARRPPKPAADTTAVYGQYLARVSCIGCHRQNLSGGPIYSAPPDWAPASNITKGGTLANYKELDFLNTLRTGKRPGGDTLNPIMPWRTIGTMSDDELRAIWNYLQSVPPAPPASEPWVAAN
jgi:mono/diheme cytochrome c family protein